MTHAEAGVESVPEHCFCFQSTSRLRLIRSTERQVGQLTFAVSLMSKFRYHPPMISMCFIDPQIGMIAAHMCSLLALLVLATTARIINATKLSGAGLAPGGLLTSSQRDSSGHHFTMNRPTDADHRRMLQTVSVIYTCNNGWDVQGLKVSDYTGTTSQTQCATLCNTSSTCQYFVLFKNGTCSLRATPFLAGTASRWSTDVTTACSRPGSSLKLVGSGQDQMGSSNLDVICADNFDVRGDLATATSSYAVTSAAQ